MRELGNLDTFCCRCWKSSHCGFGETNSPVFHCSGSEGEEGWELHGEGKGSVLSTFQVGRGQMAQLGALERNC